MVPYGDLVKTLSSEQAEPLTLALDYAKLKGMAILIVALGSVIAHTAVLFVFQLGQPRIFFSMARDGLLPAIFARVHPRFRTPWGSTLLTGVGVGVAAMFTSLEEMVDLTNIGTLFAFILVCLGIIVLRIKEPDRKRPFRVPGGLILPILGILGCLYLIRYLPTTSWERFVAWLNCGFVVYMLYGSLQSRLTGRTTAENPALHDAQSAYTGAWLATLGVLLLILARLAAVHFSAGAEAGGWGIHSGWLTLPLLMNAGLLCPAIFLRAQRAKRGELPPQARTQAHRATLLAGALLVATTSYLVGVGLF